MRANKSQSGSPDIPESVPPPTDASQGRGPDKLLAIGAYGETVAAYRYLVLAEKVSREDAVQKLTASLASKKQAAAA